MFDVAMLSHVTTHELPQLALYGLFGFTLGISFILVLLNADRQSASDDD